MSTDTETLPKRFHFETIELLPVTRAAAPDAEGEAEDEGAAAGANDEVFHVVMSSEAPCEGYLGAEVLSHAPGAIDMSLAKSGLSVYLEHGGYPGRLTPDPCLHVGVVENITRTDKRTLEGDMRFSRHELAQRVKQDVMDRTLRFLSIRARVLKRKIVRATDPGAPDQVTYTRWMPEELSVVGIPADPNASIAARSASDQYPVETEYEPTAPIEPIQEDPMSEKPEAAPAATPATPADPAAAPSVTRSAGAPANEILSLCEAHGVSVSRAREFIQQGLSITEAKSAIFDDRTTRGAARQPAAELRVNLDDMPLKDRRRYSVARAMQQAVEIKEGRRVALDGVEGEIHATIARQANDLGIPSRGGFNIPLQLLTDDERQEREWRISRAMGTGVSGGGAELVFDMPRDPLEILSNKMLCTRFGANVLSGLTGSVPMPVQTGDPTAYLVGENPSNAVTDSQLTFTLRTLNAKEAIASVPFPRRLLALANAAVDAMIYRRLFTKHALLWDNMALMGRGTDGEPTGVWYATGVNSVAFGGAPTFGKFVDMETAVTDSNVESPNTAYVTTPGMAGKCKQTPVISNAAAGMIWTGKGSDGEINGYRAGSTKQVPKTLGGSSDEHAIIFGDFSALTFGYWGALEFIVDNVTLAGKGQIKIVTNQLADVVLDRPEAFSIGTGAKLA